MIEYFDRINAEGMQQMCDSIKNHPENWEEFRPDGTSGPAKVELTPPHIANPGQSVVPPNAVGNAPVSYAQPSATVPNMTQPAPPTPTQPAIPSAPAPQYQQTQMQYTPIPNAIPSSAPVITKDQLQHALQLFASSSQARSVQVRDLLARFGVDNLNALPEAAYPEFANSLRSMGCAV